MPFVLATGPAIETNIVAPEDAARSNAVTSSRLPSTTCTFAALAMVSGSLEGVRT